MEVSCSSGKRVLWEVAYDNVVEDQRDNDEIGLWRFYFNLFDEDEGREGREVLSEYSYLLMLMQLRSGGCQNYL